MWIKTIKTFAFDLLFPKFCLCCGAEGAFLCPPCRETFTLLGSSCFACGKRDLCGETCDSCKKKTLIRRFYAPFSYKNSVIRDLVHAYKYHRVKELVLPLADFLASAMIQAGFRARRGMLFIPIPLHPRRIRERGFNQAELLAKILSEKLGVPVLARALIRTKYTASQIELADDNERRANISGAFRIADPAAVEKKVIILVDDIITSGATLNEAARILKEAGAYSILATAIARR